jgi:hypothetical protein
MKKFAIVAVLMLLLPVLAQAQTSYVTVDPAVLNLGFMNVYQLDGTTFEFASGWGFADLTAVYDGNDLTLGPNCIGDPNEYWYQCIDSVPPNCGGPGQPGNKIMEANGYAEATGLYNGDTVIFRGEVLSYSLTEAHTVKAFIKDFAADYSTFLLSEITLTGVGPFEVELPTVADPGRHIQWGFQMIGVNVWVTDLEPFGTVVIGPDYSIANEESSWGAIKNLYD